MKLKKISIVLALILSIAVCAGYPQYQELDPVEKSIVDSLPAFGSYLDARYREPITIPIRSILELGSRDAFDALKLSEHYKCHVFAFECNPEGIEMCRKSIGSNPNVTLVPTAVWDKTETISFYPIVNKPGVWYNPGASSCFPVDLESHHKDYAQTKITVPAVRLDEWLAQQAIESIDMLCIDLQGAALQALQGMGDYLRTVKYIIVELEHKSIYEGQTLYPDVEKYLESYGFQMYAGTVNSYFGDFMFIKKELVPDVWKRSNARLLFGLNNNQASLRGQLLSK